MTEGQNPEIQKTIKPDLSDSGKIVIESLADLKKQLKLEHFDISSIGELKAPIELTKEELIKLQGEMLGTNSNKLNVLKELINKKIEATAETVKSVDKLKANLETTTLTGVSAAATTGFTKHLTDIKDSEGVEKIGKIGEFFEWASNIWTKLTSFVALKFPTIAKFFGWEISPDFISKDGTKDIQSQVSSGGEEQKDDKKTPNTEQGVKAEAKEINKDAFNEYLKQRTDAMIKKLVRIGLIKEDNALVRKKMQDIFERNSGELKEDFARYSKAMKGDGTANPLDTVGISGMTALRINIDLVSEGIIPLSALLIDASTGAIKLAYNTGKTALGWSVDDMNESIGMLSFEETGEVFKKLDSKQQAILIRLFNERAIFSFALLGTLGKYISELVILGPAWNQGVGIYGIVGEVKNLTGNFDSVIKQMQKTYDLMGIGSQGTEIAKKMELIFSHVITKYAITNAYLGANGSSAEFLKNLGKFESSLGKYINADVLNQAKGLVKDMALPLSEYKSPIVALVKSSIADKLGLFDKIRQGLSGNIKGPYYNPELAVNKMHTTAELLGQGLGEEIENGKNIAARFWARAGNCGKIKDLFHQGNKASFVVNAGQEGKFAHEIGQLGKEFTPGAIANFFSHLTVIVMIGSAIATRKDEGTLAVAKQTAINMAMAIPIVGGFYMIHDGMELGKDSTFAQVGYLATGSGLVALDGYLLAKIVGKGLSKADTWLELIKFGARPITMTVETLTMATRGIFTAGNTITNLIRAVKNGEKISISKGGKWTIAVAALAALTVVGIEYLEKNKEKGEQAFAEALKIDGIADKDGQINLQNLAARFKNLPDKQRQYAVDMLASLHLGDNVDGEKYSISNSDKGGYVVNIKDAIDPRRIEQFKEVIKTSGLENIFVFSGGVKKKIDDTILRAQLPDSVGGVLMESYKSI